MKTISSTVSIRIIAALAFGFAATAYAASSCVAKVQHDATGGYSGCQVRMSGQAYSIGPKQSSEEGCAQLCSIIGEVADEGVQMAKSARASGNFHE